MNLRLTFVKPQHTEKIKLVTGFEPLTETPDQQNYLKIKSEPLILFMGTTPRTTIIGFIQVVLKNV